MNNCPIEVEVVKRMSRCGCAVDHVTTMKFTKMGISRKMQIANVRTIYLNHFNIMKLIIECIQSRGLSRRLWLSDISSQAKAVFRPSPLARLGPAYFGLAWPGSWPGAGLGTSLVVFL
jgi:hypothetical protein